MGLTRTEIKAIVKPEGYIEYNGVVFNELVKTKLEITTVKNHAGTATKYEEYLFTIEAIITPNDLRGDVILDYYAGEDYLAAKEYKDIASEKAIEAAPPTRNPALNDTTDAPFRLLRRHLMQAGGRFVYANKGAGEDLIFESSPDTPNRRQDICFGPMPKMLSFEIIAGMRAARIVFQVLVRTKHCTFFAQGDRKVVDFNLTTNIKTNASGYKVINRKGYLEISLPRNISSQTAIDGGEAGSTTYNNIFRIEESYKEVLQSLIDFNMQGYHVEHEIDFAPDHRSCTFNILYTEIESPNAYPNGVVDIQCSHNTKSSLFGDEKNIASTIGYYKWLNTMNCSIQLRPNVPPIRAWFIFTQILNERLRYEIEYAVTHDGVDRVKVPLILEIELTENIFSHEYDFKVVWLVSINNLDKLWDETKIFRPLESTNWIDWTTEMRTVNGVNGAYPLVPGKHGGDYYATNQCNNDSFNLHYSLNLETTRGLPDEFILNLFGTSCPPEDSSWIDYQRKFYVLGSIGEKTWQRYAPAEDVSRPVETDTAPRNEKSFQMLDRYIDRGKDDYFTQDFKKDQFKIVERGYAIRLGGPTIPPVWKTIGGKEVKLLPEGDVITNQIISSSGSCPMVATTWERRYIILGKPEGDMSRTKEESGDERYKQP